ncbi:hypothetical protein ISF_08077 [Cordyceps fumosorosea ARSEF 2679]|uniref:Mitochondrial adapter protein MCP1 transmembrane domain-containing protein n=1 Tax=Cordyceps fumosorosea (strain ARSEF 2679) TaxID=1081104 RepID=A0A167N5M2_CORFA|nr:hypothetical protein ISF_08077 [Cordyceps fumosorosea ARSEF 2679]OAA55156.1 hypothetical protein ISF_08077 [Cordyceps fumosorosea ARSEF 2679]
MEGTRQPLNHRASQQTIISLLELDPAPIEPPTVYDEKQLHNAADTDDSDTIMAASADSSLTSTWTTTAAPGLSTHGGHGAIFYLSRIQRYSTYAMSVFTTLHLANVSFIPAVQRSVASSETYLLMTREIYQTSLTEPLLVALPVLAHVGAGVGLRLLRRRENLRRYGGATPAAYTPLPYRSPWPPLSYISASGYVLAGFLAAHVLVNRALPLAVEGDSSSIGLAFVAHSFARHPALARAAYVGLIASAAGHMVWGAARWCGLAPSTSGWWGRSGGGVMVTRATRRRRRNRWLSVHGVALLTAAAWAVGGLGVVARSGLQDGWVGKVYDGMFARIGL